MCSWKESGRAKRDKLLLNHGTEEDETIYLAGSYRQPNCAAQAGTDQRPRSPQYQRTGHASRQVAKSYEWSHEAPAASSLVFSLTTRSIRNRPLARSGHPISMVMLHRDRTRRVKAVMHRVGARCGHTKGSTTEDKRSRD